MRKSHQGGAANHGLRDGSAGPHAPRRGEAAATTPARSIAATLARAFIAWLLILALAIVNGVLREVVLIRTRVPVARLLGDAIAHADPRARERGVTLVVPPVDDALQVLADADRLQLVFANLLGNAIRH